MLMPVVFVCVTMAVAFLGNTAVLIVFNCRWRSSGATKVCVLSLATLDLLCAAVSTPRELLPLLGTFNAHNARAGEFCRVATFLVFLLNFTSALVLIVIALIRFLKVKDDGLGVEGHVMCRAVRVKVMMGLRALRSVKGVKLASAVCLGVALAFTCPVLVFYSPGNMPRGGLNSTITSCWVYTDPKYNIQLRTFQSVLFFIFVAIAVTVTGIYSAIVQHIWVEKKRDNSELTRPVSYKRQSSSHLGSLCGSHSAVSRAVHPPLGRTVSDTGAAKSPKHDLRVLRALSDSEACRLHVNKARPGNDMICPVETIASQGSELERVKDQDQNAPGGGGTAADSWENPLPEESADAELPPISFTAQQMSLSSLNVSQENVIDAERVAVSLPCPSVSSIQFNKHGHKAQTVTLVFICISVIFILSYLPFFAVNIFSSRSDSGFVGMLARSYLISNAANPLVYAFGNPHFRSSLWKLLLCRREII